MKAKPSSSITKPKGRRLTHSYGSKHDYTNLQPSRLPADQAVRQQAIIKLRSPTGNARNVAAIIEHCPVLSLKLFCATNRQLNLSDNHCQNLVHAIGLLGMPMVESLIKKAPVFDDASITKEAKEGYQRALASSQLAADWVQQWSSLSPHWHAYGDVLTWATLFQRAPLWALWLEDGSAMAAHEYLRAKRGGANHPYIAGLNNPTSAIIATVGKRWHLPTFCQQSWQPAIVGNGKDWLGLQASVDDQQSAYFCHHPAFAVALANQLADQTSWGWTDHRATRLFKLLTASLNNQRATNLSHQQVANSSRERSLPFASELLCDYKRGSDLFTRRTPPPIHTEDSTGREQAVRQPIPSPITQPLIDHRFHIALARLSKRPDSFNDQHQVFNYLLQTLRDELKFARGSVMLYNASNDQLRTAYSLDIADSSALKNFSHSLKNNDFFSMLLKKPASFHLHADNYQKFWPLLPKHFREAIKNSQFFIMSLFVNNKPFALIYGDYADQSNSSHETQYQQFKQLCRATSHCLDAVNSH